MSRWLSVLCVLYVHLCCALCLPDLKGACSDSEHCVHSYRCPQWNKDIEAWKILKLQLDPDSTVYKEKFNQLKSRVCSSKPNNGVCCAQPSGCDPSSPSCLPSFQCGLAGGAAKVNGGEKTKPGEFPSTALLGSSITKEVFPPHGPAVQLNVTDWKCGGTLINRWFVVTAAHCHGGGDQDITKVRLGEYHVTSANGRDCVADGKTCLPPVQDFDIQPEAITIHPEYDLRPNQVYNDIALIRLPSPAVLNMAVQVVCLPLDAAVTAKALGVSDLEGGLDGTWPYLVGWGHTDPFSINKSKTAHVPSEQQQKLVVPLVPAENCSLFNPIHSQLCAGGQPGKDSCKGDSGGPLYLKSVIAETGKVKDDSSPWYLLGIVSFGTRVCGTGVPGIYTRVETFIPWIEKTVQSTGTE